MIKAKIVFFVALAALYLLLVVVMTKSITFGT